MRLARHSGMDTWRIRRHVLIDSLFKSHMIETLAVVPYSIDKMNISIGGDNFTTSTDSTGINYLKYTSDWRPNFVSFCFCLYTTSYLEVYLSEILHEVAVGVRPHDAMKLARVTLLSKLLLFFLYLHPNVCKFIELP